MPNGSGSNQEKQMKSRRAGDVPAGLQSGAMWHYDAGSAEYVVPRGKSNASIRLLGKHLRPLRAFGVIGLLGYRYVPELMSSVIQSRVTPGAREVRRQERQQTNALAKAALRDIVSAEHLNIEWPAPGRAAPLLKAAKHRKYLFRSLVSYGDSPTQVLDVWRRKGLPVEPAPVLVFVPGGGWVYGSRNFQGYALMAHLAAQGWVCLPIDYRVAPRHRWPRHIADVQAAVAWARANVDQFGGDRGFVAIAGCSAGGHLAALNGLSINDPDLQQELPADADTSVDAVVGMYGRYDWEDRSTPERERFMDFLERVIVKRRQYHHPEVYRAASPIARVRPDAPPFFVVHGTADTLIPVWQARAFVDKLRGTSRSPVGYLELPGGHHGFDMTDGSRTGSAVTAIGLFLNEIHRRHLLKATGSVS
jgi:acetyl esterase/lipase